MPEPEIELPEGVTTAEWELERDELQNLRIRTLAAGLRTADEILESDFAFLHCSPELLQQIWNRLLEVRTSLRQEIRRARALTTPPHCHQLTS